MILWTFFMLVKAFGSKLAEYRLGYNFGQIFQDFSYNSQTAVNGLSSADTISDVIFTDRGAYFDGNSAQITLPANDQVSEYFYLPSVFSMSMWVNSEEVDGLVVYRHKDDNNFFYIERLNSGKKIKFRLVLESLDTGEKKSSGNAFQGSTWVLITLIISEIQLKIYSNLNNEISLSLSSIYTESGTYQSQIGGIFSTQTSFKGFIYYFIICDDASSYLSLILASTITTCLNDNGGCPNSCNPAIVDPYKGIGCLPNKKGYTKDSLENTCNCLGNSCIIDLCLECNCNTLSCILDNNNIYCYCQIGYYLNNNQCLPCDSSCLTCESELACLTCKTTYAKPDNIGCTCMIGYYPIGPLTNADSCAICYEECESCEDYNLCTTCVSENAYPSQTGCQCKDGYWGISPLNSIDSCQNCHEDCYSCEDSFTCLICISTYAVPSDIGCKCKTGYWGSSPLNNENSCLPCSDGCLICDNTGMCLQCISNNTIIIENKCICQSGFYSIGSLIFIDSCKPCDIQCSECDSQYHCLSCTSLFAYALETYGCACLSGYFSLEEPKFIDSCKPCYEECAECDNSLKCLSCKSKNANVLDVKGCKCNDGYWNDTSLVSEFTCQKCSEECSLCENEYSCLDCISLYSIPKDTGCQCIDGYYADGDLVLVDSCIPCAKECLKCQKAILCVNCIAEHAVPDNILGCVCESGYYNIKDLSYEDACLPCDDSCLTCTGPDTCSACKDINAILSFNNTCICADGYYYDENNNSCSPCNSDCEICTNDDACSFCTNSLLENQSSICTCKDGYFTTSDPSFLCSPCIQDCLTCENASSCLTCKKESANFINQACECPDNSYEKSSKCLCNPGFYMSYNKTWYSCEKCSLECKTCSSFSNCLSCVDPNEIITNSGICEKLCNKSEYLYNGICNPCKKLCLDCKSDKICNQCDMNTILTDGICQCIKGYKELDNQCISSNFTANLDINTNNKLQLTFEKPLEEKLIAQEITIKTIPIISFDIKFYEHTSKIYYITPNFESSVKNGTILTLTITKNPLYSNDSSLLINYEFSVILNPIDNNKATTLSTETAKKIEAATQTVVTTSIGISIVSNPAAVWALINTLQLIYYLPLGSTPMTKGLQVFCSSLGNYNIIPNPMSIFFSYNLTTSPYHEANDFGLETSVFLINIGPNLLILFSFIILWPLLFLLSKLATGWIKRKSNTLLIKYKYRFFIRFWTQVYIDIIIYAFIQLKSTSKSFLGNLNIACALVLTVTPNQIISVFTPPFILVTSFINKNDIFNSSNTEFYKQFGTLYDEFKNNKGFTSCLYYFVYFTRRLFYAIVQIFLNSRPFLQTILNIIISFSQVIFIVKYKPFKSWAIFVTNFVGEMNTFLAFVLLVLFHFKFSEQYLEEIEGTIIFLIITAMGVHVVVDVYMFFIDMRELWKKIEYKRAKAFLQATQGNKNLNGSNGSTVHLNGSLSIKLEIVK
ncbi:hypothetical protein SteCoe_6627 [Stentor coeruleus]|uniref:EGF-like domain-containing protein n=1 Tax=Stentor coeruleus TaxID=5963 RepID=A0A1R2CPM2_9CILI|nr:hypothetical protein SteCoe_6627 [Stentor coeruleus]